MKNIADQNQSDANFPIGENEEQVKNQMWAHISTATQFNSQIQNKKKRLFKISTYAVAASLVIIAGIIVILQINRFSTVTTINNLSELQARQVRIGGLKFILQPKSEFTIQASGINGAMSLKFCGAVSVQNTSTSAKQLQVASGLFSCTVVVNDSINLHKGQTYLAMTDQQYTMISATTEEIIDGLPRPFSSRLEKRFNL